MKIFISIFSGLITILALDYIWLSVIAKNFIFKSIGHILNIQNGVLVVNYLAAFLFYVLAPIGIYIFVTSKAGSLSEAVLYGFLLGAFAYATYDLTNKATITNYPWSFAVLDIFWGGVVFASASAVMYLVLKF